MKNINKATLWQERQNKPSLVAQDLCQYGVSEETVYDVLLRRGIFKWLAVRRKLIRLKDKWRKEITWTIENIRLAKKQGSREALYWHRGYLKALEDCRKAIRELCHSDRWQAPDNDKKAQEFLSKKERMENNGS